MGATALKEVVADPARPGQVMAAAICKRLHSKMLLHSVLGQEGTAPAGPGIWPRHACRALCADPRAPVLSAITDRLAVWPSVNEHWGDAIGRADTGGDLSPDHYLRVIESV